MNPFLFPFHLYQNKRLKKLYRETVFSKEYSLKYLRRYFPKELFSKKLDVLDFGCGMGRISQMFATLGHTVTAIDKVRYHTWKKYPEISFLQSDNTFELLKSIQDRFDVVIIFQVSRYLPNYLEIWKELAGKLKPDGMMLVQLVSRNNLVTRLTGKKLGKNNENTVDFSVLETTKNFKHLDLEIVEFSTEGIHIPYLEFLSEVFFNPVSTLYFKVTNLLPDKICSEITFLACRS